MKSLFFASLFGLTVFGVSSLTLSASADALPAHLTKNSTAVYANMVSFIPARGTAVSRDIPNESGNSNFDSYLPTVMLAIPSGTPPGPSNKIGMGLNKPELFAEFTGLPPYTWQASLAQAAAIQSLQDAHNLGFNYMRINAGGFCPPDFALWQNTAMRSTWWLYFDEMVNEAQTYGIKLVPDIAWNKFVFPDMVGEPLSALFDFTTPSKSNALLKQFTYELISRYKSNPAILFWELGNEFNLGADEIITSDPCGTLNSGNNNYSTAQLGAFENDLANYIKSIDPTHPISSGNSRPRPIAYGLSQCPQWQAGCPTYPPQDTFAQQVQWLQKVYPAPIDIMSVHLYPDSKTPWTITNYQQMATDINRTLYVGEFGDIDSQGNWVYPSTFVANILNNLVSGHTPYSSPWRWAGYKSFNPNSPYTYDIDPVVNPSVVNELVATNNQLKQ